MICEKLDELDKQFIAAAVLRAKWSRLANERDRLVPAGSKPIGRAELRGAGSVASGQRARRLLLD